MAGGKRQEDTCGTYNGEPDERVCRYTDHHVLQEDDYRDVDKIDGE